jgi:hypothetical protein
MRVAACALSAVLVAAGSAHGQVDGTVSGGDGYGAPYAVQTVETGFGDNFSELNAAYARVSGGRFYLALTGNLEANFNKLEIFLQTGAGGSNVFTGVPGNDGTNVMTGLTFAGGFAPNYHLIARRGFDGFQSRFDLDFAQLNTPNFSFYPNVFGGQDFGQGATGTGLNLSPIEIAYNGSNVAGVVGGSGPANQAAAAAVTTGIELSIALSDLGLQDLVGETICVMAFINGSNHNYGSNQFLPGLIPPQGNLGGDGSGGFNGTFALNLNQFMTEGYFVVPVPAPASASLLALGGLLAARRRR